MSAIILLILRVALTVALYVFLGWALWVLFQDMRRARLALEQIPPLSLRLVNAANLELPGGERTYYFSGAPVTIGREPACECWLDEKTISARHARLDFHHGQWWAEDLQSKNGTLLNGAPLVGAVVLASGDHLQCGVCRFMLTIGRDDITPAQESSEGEK